MDYQGEHKRALLALLRIPGLGPVKLSEILAACDFKTSALFDSSGKCRVFQGQADWAGVDQDLAWGEQDGCHIISHHHSAYPRLLKEIHSAPPILFVGGNLKILAKPQIAMVGSRNPTPTGSEMAFQFARHFSKMGFAVTSGLAIGIDAAAHQGALLGRGGTIAVLGHGLDTIYPASHRKLAHQIIEAGGALVSEFPMGVPALSAHFPRRNRIISGFSMGTLVVEAALNSGSLITAKCALNQGREVFAIPGSIHNPLVKGCHALIREGAKLVERAEDVLEELGAFISYLGGDRHANQRNAVELEKPFEQLLAEVGYDCTPVDEVVVRSGLTAQKVSSMLLELELKGHVVAVPGGYARVVA